jgi:hypothetical protein
MTDATLLDAAFQILITHPLVRTDPQNLYVSLDKARIHELKRRFPEVEAQTVEDAYRSAEHLCDVAAELADRCRGPQNDHTGPSFDEQTLAERCPGFSLASYGLALNEGYMLTR